MHMKEMREQEYNNDADDDYHRASHFLFVHAHTSITIANLLPSNDLIKIHRIL